MEKIVIKAPAINVLSLDLRMTYDPASAAVAQVQLGPLAGGMTLAVNTIKWGDSGRFGGRVADFGRRGGVDRDVQCRLRSAHAIDHGPGQRGEVPSEITVNTAPALATIADQTINEGAMLTISAGASDTDAPTNTLTFSLDSPPTGASIDPTTGVLTWTPTEAQGPSTNPMTVRVTDNGVPSLSDTKSFTVTVNEKKKKGEHRAGAGGDWQPDDQRRRDADPPRQCHGCR